MSIPSYAEIGITTNFSFLRGGSDPRAYVHQASKLGLAAIGIADHNTLAGVVRMIAVDTGQPVTRAAVIDRLFRERLDALNDPLDPGFGFDLIRLSASRV